MITKTLTLREAVCLNGFAYGDFEALLRALHQNNMQTPQQRTAPSGASFVQCRTIRRAADHMLLHLVGYTPDDRIQVLPLAGQDVELAEAPNGMEFLDGEMMLLVKENSVLVCRCGLPDGALMAYVDHFATAAGLDSGVYRFTLGKRIDVDKLALIAEEGVHRIKLNAIAHSVSVDEAERATVRKKITGRVLDEIKDILALEADVPEDAENLKVEVSLAFDKRRGGAIDSETLQHLAETVIGEDDDGFQIETMTGRKVRAADVLLSKSVEMEKFGKSVRHFEAWGHLREFDAELRDQING